MTDYVLGLDLGSNSVGWAIISQDGTPIQDGRRALAGVRVFPEGVENMNSSKEKPRSQSRRMARGQRRTHQRRAQRCRKLLAILRAAGMAPSDPAERLTWLANDPYSLRTKGLDEALELRELGRAIFHIGQRRGFKSNRKQEKAKEAGEVAKKTAELHRKIEEAKCRTLGEYLHLLGANHRHTSPQAERVRNRYTLRSMYEEEFEKLWSVQSPAHPEVLTDTLRAAIRDALFFQRPLRFDPGVIGECELEPGQKRCPRAHWEAQQFRMIQEINVLRVIDPTGEERPLTPGERNAVLEALAPRKEMSFGEIRQLLGFLDSQTFNIEELGKRKGLKGNPIEAGLARKPLDKWYASLPSEKRQAVYDALAEEQDEQRLHDVAVKEWGLDEAHAQKLLKIGLPTGHFKLSLLAIRKIMPLLLPAHEHTPKCLELMARRGETRADAPHPFSEAKELAGYALTGAIERHDSLPPVGEALKNLTNPLVRRALSEARRVVNAIVREFGLPARIVVELARDMKHTPQKRRQLFYESLDRRDENDEIRQRIPSEFPGVTSPSRDDVIKYKLWKECGEICPYTGRPIPAHKLFTAEVQIEHILPYSRTLDDSFLNKSLCYEDENRTKHNRTPFEAYGADQAKYDAILQRVARLPYPKRRKFMQKEVKLDACVQRQLNDTRYISRAAVDYLRMLYGSTPDIKVSCVKGGTTAELRHQWGLDEILGLRGEKNRLDHRHHAVDAAVIAMTSASALQRLSSVKYSGSRRQLDPPWDGFRDDLAGAVHAINVSHRPTRKISGALHEETALGPIPGKDRAGKPTNFVHRVPVDRLTESMIAAIRDPAIRKIVQDAAAARGTGKALVNPPLTMPSGVPIKRVRVESVERTAVPVRTGSDGQADKYLLPGGNHHVEIYELPDGTWTGRAISRFEAHLRVRRAKPVVDRNGAGGGKFVMSLCMNDMLLITLKGNRALYRVQNTSVSSPLLVLRMHTAALTDDDVPEVKAARHLVATWESFRKLSPEKVTVDPLGRIHPCHD
ncbi:MAG: type II CRISPR RNA-guided endonuclease Cas9 [Phycisphaerae bacterium]